VRIFPIIHISNIVYAATHQFGDDERNIPARPYLGLSQENAQDVLDVIEDWIDQQIRRMT
jgi:phage gpG-like protein